MSDIKKLFPYYGSKELLIEDIVEEAKPAEGNIETFVDVFGGSGKVSLNVPEKIKARKIVYNDKDKRLSDTMEAIGDKELRKSAVEILKNTPINRKKFEQIKNSEIFLNTKDENAANTMYLAGTSFNNTLKWYRPNIDKNKREINNIIENVNKHGDYVGRWKIENADFRDIIPKYDSSKTLFYLDPPYIRGGERVYSEKFGIDDLKDLKELISNSNSNYILSESQKDIPEVKALFGEPSKIVSHYAHPRGKASYQGEAIWKEFSF